MGSLDTFVQQYGGSKRTWKTCLDKFHVLGLLSLHKPRLNDPENFYNTDIQEYSAERARVRAERQRQAELDFGNPAPSIKVYPVTWHGIPLYTPDLLAYAESRVCDVIAMGNGINKDAISDIYGITEAHRITDTGYTTHPDTLVRREMLKTVMLSTLDEKGYTASQELLQRAMQLCPGYSVYRWEETWKAYKPYLFKVYNLKESRPTKAEKEVFKIETDKHIIRRVG